MRVIPSLISLSLALLLAACAGKAIDTTIAEGGKKLSSDELNTLVGGNTLKMEEYGLKATVECFLDGKLAGVNSENTKTAGRWQVDEKGRFCLRYKRLGGVDDFCYTIYKVGDEYRQFTDNGALSGSFTVEEGNSRDAAGAGAVARTQKSTPTPRPSTAPPSPRAERSAFNYLPPPEVHAESDIRFFHLEMARDCPGCNLAGVDFEGARLLDANLPGADLRRARLRKSNLRGANLRGANLEGADLREANLAGANLAGANLTGADLTDANLTRANLQGANLDNVRGADLNNAFR